MWEVWFDEKEGMMAAFGTPEGKADAEDDIAHCWQRRRLVREEKTILAGDKLTQVTNVNWR